MTDREIAGSKAPLCRPAPLLAAAAATLLAFVLYLVTLAPTVLWGDDAELQRLAFTGGGEVGARAHPLWVAIGRQFVHLPFGDVAWRANLLSAVSAAIAVGFVFAAGWTLTRSLAGASLGAAALAVSHTFWLHAVRAEVYALYAAFLSAVLFLLLLWRASGRDALLFAAAFLAGLALLAHPLILTALPGIALFVAATPQARAARAYLSAVAGFATGALPYVLWQGSGGAAALGTSGLGVLSSISLLRPRDFALWAGFLAYQFWFAVPLGLLGLVQLWRRDRDAALFLTLVFLGDVAFTLAFTVPDQYVFYLPSYVVFALWIGVGLAGLARQLARPASLRALAALVVLAPPFVYRMTPAVLNSAGIQLLSVRRLPNRDNNTFFLYPPKNGYYGAREFGETAMRDLPANAAVLADWLPLQTLRYLQVVEGQRPDVDLAEIYAGRGEQVQWLLAQSQARPVFIAGTGRYYDLAEIERYFRVEPFGPIYRLEQRR